MLRHSFIAAALFLTACPDNPAQLCDSECPLGQVCDYATGECVDTPLETYEGDLSGRYSTAVGAQNRVFYAGFGEDGGSLVAGELLRSSRTLHVLTKLTRSRPLSMAASSTRVTVVWLGDDNRFRYATRRVDNESPWTFGVVETDTVYAGTHYFAAAHTPDGGLSIAFQATDRTLKNLETTDLSAWTLTLVDDGSRSANGVECPDTLRGTRRPGGVGVEPSVAATAEGIWVAYQDADCGDLRLARKLDGPWSVDVVDSGNLDTTPVTQRGRTGRWSSIAVGPAGKIGVAYQDEVRGVLKYATTSGTEYQIETVDDGYVLDVNANVRKDLVGAWAQLAFDARGAPTIAYMNQSTADLRLASRPQTGSRWVQRTIVSDGLVGFSAQLVERSDGRTILSERIVPQGAKSELVEVWE